MNLAGKLCYFFQEPLKSRNTPERLSLELRVRSGLISILSPLIFDLNYFFGFLPKKKIFFSSS